MANRHVERFEIVPVSLDFGAFRHTEPQADEDVFQPLPGLGSEVSVAASRRSHEFSEIESFVFDLLCQGRSRENGAPDVEGHIDRRHRVVDGSACRLLLLD